ncbi:MAG: phosphatidate cytidylyltransferase [Clostridia bacterium]|nr:phosphatidate cytidylyltransferase [Clostridia bacterium]
MVKKRAPVAVGMVVLTLVLCLWGPVPRLLFLLSCGLVATWETWHILSPQGHWAYGAVPAAFVLICGLLSLFHGAVRWYLVAFFAAVHLILAVGALTYREGKGRDALMALAALVYPGSLFAVLLHLSQLSHWFWPFAVGQLTAWICDSAALIVGKRWGKHPLPTPVSPHKTVEGCVAGAVAALPTGLLCWALFRGACPLSLWAWMLICLLCSSWGQIGDLAASLVKRAAGAKDFSNLLGPHGGVMDKFDSMVFSIPLAYLCLIVAGVM